MTAACLIDNVLAASANGPSPKSGYSYFITGAPPNAGVTGDYVIGGNAITINSTGTNNLLLHSRCSGSGRRRMRFRQWLPAQLAANASLAGCQTITAYGPIQ